ncbi:MAG: WD40 repeat domain-containing protein [Oscillatoria princeps RMCB-10]|jgi:WD40 repeat protein|nr:WD40 repeat domain-containing protein [Oscillatoria princeps RMCB-10]
MSKIREWLAGASPEEREQRLLSPAYLAAAGDLNQLYDLLTDFDFIQAKVDALGVQPAIQDCRLVTDSGGLLCESQTKTLKLIQGALDLSAHVLQRDKTQLAGQLLGRLLSFEVPDIQNLLEAAKQSKEKPWLRLLTPSLTPPGGAPVSTLTGHTGSVNAVALTPDGKTAVSASNDRTLKVWDLRSGELKSTLTGHTDMVRAVAVTPDGKTAVSASSDNTLKVWDLLSGESKSTLTGHTDEVNAVALTPDGKTAVSASDDRTLKVWDLLSGEPRCTLTGHTYRVNSVAVTPDGKTAVSASRDNTLKVWDFFSGEEVACFTGDSALLCCAVAPDGVTVVAGDKLGRVHFLRLEGHTGTPAARDNPRRR